jgi:hypothetical protein
MSNKMRNIILLGIFLGCFCFSLLADSPLTSTDIHLGYKHEPIVAEALEFKVLSKNILEYLSSPKNPIAIKIAVINALGWNINGTTYAETFYKYLQNKNDYESIDDFIMSENGELIICLAYFRALGDYFEVDDAIWIAKYAIKRSNSYTVHIICALIEAQKAMDDDLCEVYELVNRVRENDMLIDDMNEEAKAEIFVYMDMYDCSQGGE